MPAYAPVSADESDAVSLVRGSRIAQINDKMIVLSLQAHNHRGGLISYFNADRGGQAYAYKPELP